MRKSLAIGLAAASVLAAGAAEAGDSRLSCTGDAKVMPDQSSAPIEVQLTVQGGLEGPTGVTYAWPRAEGSVPLTLKGLIGDTLQFHGMGMDKDGSVLVADAQLNRTTLALAFKVRRLGASEEDVTLETVCRAA